MVVQKWFVYTRCLNSDPSVAIREEGPRTAHARKGPSLSLSNASNASAAPAFFFFSTHTHSIVALTYIYRSKDGFQLFIGVLFLLKSSGLQNLMFQDNGMLNPVLFIDQLFWVFVSWLHDFVPQGRLFHQNT